MNHSFYHRGRQDRPLLLAVLCLGCTAAIAQIVTPIEDGGTGAGTAAGARTNLGLGTASSPTFANLTLTSGLSLADGSTAAPSFFFTANPTTGIARAATNSLEITTGGVRSGLFTTTGMTVSANFTANGTSHAFGAAGGGSNIVNVNGSPGAFKFLGFNSGGTSRWILGSTGDAEAGSDAGSPFRLSAFTDGGSTIDNPISIVRAANGALTIARPTIARGTITNDNAATGYIGEFLSSNVAQGSSVPLTHATGANVTSLSLTAGDWDVQALAAFIAGSGAIVTQTASSISTTSGTAVTSAATIINSGVPATLTAQYPTAVTRISVASTTTVYLVSIGYFSGGTLGAYGYLSARRVR